ncbi:MAG: nuclear transport factor 2 family protein, partial [Dehalococcoidia bacterium]
SKIDITKQIAPFKRPDGSNYEVAGIRGSWFRYAGNYRWCQQKGFFDIGNVAALLGELDQAGLLDDVMKEKIRKGAEGELMPGHVRRQG